MRSTELSTYEYPAFPKIPRLNRTAIITEKIDGTNALVAVYQMNDLPVGAHGVRFDDLVVCAGSRNRWISPESDNHGFARWVWDNAEELVDLGAGLHYGEWYGKGIQRGYGLDEKRFALFNSDRWADPTHRPACCEVVPVIDRTGSDLSGAVDIALARLRRYGSIAVPGYDRPEGIVVWHTAAGSYFKVLLEGDELPKGSPSEMDCA